MNLRILSGVFVCLLALVEIASKKVKATVPGQCWEWEVDDVMKDFFKCGSFILYAHSLCVVLTLPYAWPLSELNFTCSELHLRCNCIPVTTKSISHKNGGSAFLNVLLLLLIIVTVMLLCLLSSSVHVLTSMIITIVITIIDFFTVVWYCCFLLILEMSLQQFLTGIPSWQSY